MSELLGKKVRDLRKQKGISMEKLAELAYSTKGYIHHIETSILPNPGIDKVAKIAAALGVTIDYLANDAALLNQDVAKNAFFMKFNGLEVSDQIKVEQIIDIWSVKNE